MSFDDVSRDLGEWFTLVHGSYDDISPNNGELLINGVDKGTALCGVAKDLATASSTQSRLATATTTPRCSSRGHVRGDGQRHSRIECFCDMTTTDIHDDGIANAFVTLGLI